MRDEPQPVRRPVARRLVDRLAARLATTARSSSLIALAIHVTSWWATRLRSAVTSPPPPRRATRLPSSSRANDDRARGSRRRSASAPVAMAPTPAGPERSTTSRRRRRRCPRARLKSASQSRRSRGIRNRRRTSSFPRSARAPRRRRVVEDLTAGVGALLDRVHEPARLAVADLRDDPADAAADRRPAFQSASVTVSPKPSRIDFWITAAECTWNAFTSTEPMLFRFERMKMSGSPAAWATVWL